MVTQTYTISTVKNTVPPKVKMSQYDSASRTITFSVVDGSGSAVSLTGKTVTVEGTRIDGHAFAANCTVSGSTVTFTETVDMTNTAGDHPAEIVIRENGQRLGTMNFVISVEPAAMDEGANITHEDLPLYQQLFKGLASAPMIYNTASGNIASFSDGADGYPLKGLTVAVEPSQSGSGDPSPSNVRPISGFSEVKVARAGKNLISIEDDAIFEQQRYTAEYGEGSVIVTASGTYSRVGYGYAVKKGEQYTVSFRGKSTGNYNRVYIGYNKSNINAYYTYITLTETETQYTYSFTASTEELVIVFYVTTNANSGVMTITDFQVELGSTATSYEPYAGDTYTISLGETVYGGTLDVVGGKMVVDRKAVDLGDLSWTMSSTRFYSNLTDAIATKSGGDVNAVCSSYRRVPYNNAAFATGDFCVCDSNFSGTKRCLFQNANIASADDFKTSVTGQTMVYSLKTPIEITLTPTQINTLLGVNNIYSDAGDVSVEYPADTKQFILNAIASALA